MQRIIIAATILLLIQIGLVVTLNINTRSFEAFVPNTRLFEVTSDSVDSFTIIDADSKKLLFKKELSAWFLPDYLSVPADNKQVTEFLDKLTTLKQGLTVATSKGSYARFKVSDDIFERRIVFNKGDTVIAEIYTGTSPGFRKVHARLAGQSEVMTLKLNNFELETAADYWIDKNMIQVEEKDINSVTMADFSLKRNSDGWYVTSINENQEMNTQQADALLEKISGLTIQTVIDPKEASEEFEKETALKYTISYINGNKEDFVFIKSEEDYYILKTSNRKFFFKVNSLLVEAITKNTISDLVQAKRSKPEAEKN